MRTKFSKYLMLGLAAFMAAVTFTACSDDDDNSIAQSVAASNVIKFNASVEGPEGTRAIPLTSNNFQDLLTSFRVWAITPGTGGSLYWGNSLIIDQVFSNNGKGTVYTSAQPFYWPASDSTFDFLAVAGNVNGVQVASSNAMLVDYTVPTDLSLQQDIMAAYANTNRNAKKGQVDLTFKHLLSQVRFAATSAGTEANDITVKIKSVKIHNLWDRIHSTFTNGAVGKAIRATGFGLANYDIGLTSVKEVHGANKVLLYNTDKGKNVTAPGVLLLAPQTRSAAPLENNGIHAGLPVGDASYLEIECYIHDNKTGRDIIGTSDSFGTMYVPFKVDWEAGKCYTCILNFNGDNGFGYDDKGNPIAYKVSINVKVDNWQNASDVTTNI